MTTLFVIATPIGNLADISQRALTVLQQVDFIAAEDTRHSQRLLQHYGIQTPLISLHAHNEAGRTTELIQLLQTGKSIALISDAGTPLVHDPGWRLLQAAHQHEIPVSPIPGACAAIAALAVAGMPADQFHFLGFLASKAGARQQQLMALRYETSTLVLYEAPHRIVELLQDIADCLGADRELVIARELTKHYETIKRGHALQLLQWITENTVQQRGEFVIVIAGASMTTDQTELQHAIVVARLLLQELPIKKAASLAAQICKVSKNKLYQALLSDGE